MNRRNVRRRYYSLRWDHILIALVSIVLVAIFISCATPEVQAADHMTDSNGIIRYEYVNMRQEPSTGAKIVEVLYEGTSVSFTGNYIDYFLNDIYPLWVEVEVDGQTGWIVIESVSGFRR